MTDMMCARLDLEVRAFHSTLRCLGFAVYPMRDLRVSDDAHVTCDLQERIVQIPANFLRPILVGKRDFSSFILECDRLHLANRTMRRRVAA